MFKIVFICTGKQLMFQNDIRVSQWYPLTRKNKQVGVHLSTFQDDLFYGTSVMQKISCGIFLPAHNVPLHNPHEATYCILNITENTFCRDSSLQPVFASKRNYAKRKRNSFCFKSKQGGCFSCFAFKRKSRFHMRNEKEIKRNEAKNRNETKEAKRN